MNQNIDLRLYAKGKGVPLWLIAKEMGVSEPTILRWLRVPFSQEKADEFRAIVDKIAKGG